MAKEVFNNKKVLLTKSLNKELKKQIVKSVVECCIVWSRDMYGDEGRCKGIGSF